MTCLCTMHKFHFYFQHACNCSCLAVNSPSIRAQGNILVISPSKQIHFYIFHLLKCVAVEKTEGDTGFMKPICCTQARKILVFFLFVCLFFSRCTSLIPPLATIRYFAIAFKLVWLHWILRRKISKTSCKASHSSHALQSFITTRNQKQTTGQITKKPPHK